MPRSETRLASAAARAAHAGNVACVLNPSEADFLDRHLAAANPGTPYATGLRRKC